jgi:hypothetical protein
MSVSLFCKMWGLSSSVDIVEGRMWGEGILDEEQVRGGGSGLFQVTLLVFARGY